MHIPIMELYVKLHRPILGPSPITFDLSNGTCQCGNLKPQLSVTYECLTCDIGYYSF